MTTRIPTNVRNAMADAGADLADAGASPGELRVYTGAQPASSNDAASGTLLVTFVLSDPAWGASAAGVKSGAGLPKAAVGVADGTAGWGRVVDSDGNAVVDGAVTATGGGGEIQLDNTSIATDQDANLTALTFAQASGE